jgi:hypothetical protein
MDLSQPACSLGWPGSQLGCSTSTVQIVLPLAASEYAVITFNSAQVERACLVNKNYSQEPCLISLKTELSLA